MFPSDLLLHAKALTTAEVLAFTLTPHLKFETEMRPIIARELAKWAADLGRLKVQAERVLPELLLFGELPPASLREASSGGVPLQFGWGEVLKALGEQVKTIQPDMTNLRTVLEPSVRSVLMHLYTDHEINMLLDDTWARYSGLVPSIPSQETALWST